MRPPSRPPSAHSDDEDMYPLRHKSVAFSSLSPQSSRVLRQHRRHRTRSPRSGSKPQDFHDSEPLARRRRHSSGPPAARQMAHDDSTDSDSEVEYLPDRFDSHGRPLSPSARKPGWTQRSGQFHRKPRRPRDWNVDGGWHVAGTDREAVERMAEGLRDVVDGRMSWLGLIGGVMEGLEDGRGGKRGDGKPRWRDLMR